MRRGGSLLRGLSAAPSLAANPRAASWGLAAMVTARRAASPPSRARAAPPCRAPPAAGGLPCEWTGSRQRFPHRQPAQGTTWLGACPAGLPQAAPGTAGRPGGRERGREGGVGSGVRGELPLVCRSERPQAASPAPLSPYQLPFVSLAPETQTPVKCLLGFYFTAGIAPSPVHLTLITA